MKKIRPLFPLSLAMLAPLSAFAQNAADANDPLLQPIAAKYAERWAKPQQPVRLFGNSFYVGTESLSIVLVDTGAGLILFDGALPQFVRMTQTNIRALGFDPKHIKFIFVSEAHYDHAGGIAALARDSGATVVTSASTAPEMLTGVVGKDDPQASIADPMYPVTKIKMMRDGEVLRLGNVAVTGHATEGHTKGSMSWSWRSCEGNACANLIFVSSLNAVSADGYRFIENPSRVAMLRHGMAKLATLPCDIAIPSHADTTDLPANLAKLIAKPSVNPLFAPGQCKSLAALYTKRLNDRLANERASGN